MAMFCPATYIGYRTHDWRRKKVGGGGNPEDLGRGLLGVTVVAAWDSSKFRTFNGNCVIRHSLSTSLTPSRPVALSSDFISTTIWVTWNPTTRGEIEACVLPAVL